jgi:hypothetical protein
MWTRYGKGPCGACGFVRLLHVLGLLSLPKDSKGKYGGDMLLHIGRVFWGHMSLALVSVGNKSAFIHCNVADS